MRLWPQPQNKYCEINGKRMLSDKEATRSVNAHASYGKYLRKYICNYCGAFHLTSKRQ